MSIFDLTVTPSMVSAALQGNTALYPSPLIDSVQTLDRGGLKWKFDLTYNALRADKRATVLALLAALRGQSNRVRVQVYDNPKRGAYGGTPLVAGASQTGNTLNIDGCSISVTNWIRAGDYFSVVVNGEHELKMATQDANSSGTGTATLTFEPRLRASPLDNAVILVEDGVLARPKGVFLLANAETGWTSRPGVDSKVSSLTISLIEDVFATQ